MSQHEIEVDFYCITADAAETVGGVWIVFEYTPAEAGRGMAYAAPEPSYAAEVSILRVEYRQPDKVAQELPAFIVDAIEANDFIGQLMFDHVEGGL